VLVVLALAITSACGAAPPPEHERRQVIPTGRACVADDGEAGAVLVAVGAYAKTAFELVTVR